MKNKNLNFFCFVLIIIFLTTSLKSDEVKKLIAGPNVYILEGYLMDEPTEE